MCSSPSGCRRYEIREDQLRREIREDKIRGQIRDDGVVKSHLLEDVISE
jgi:hypothetical protein